MLKAKMSVEALCLLSIPLYSMMKIQTEHILPSSELLSSVSSLSLRYIFLGIEKPTVESRLLVVQTAVSMSLLPLSVLLNNSN